jgi:hypothetical protein
VTETNGSERFLMVSDLRDFIFEQTGIRIAPTTIEKLSAPGRADSIPVDAFWGKRPLRKPSTVLAWAKSRLRPAKPTEAA